MKVIHVLLIFIICSSLAACLLASPNFDEQKWREKVDQSKIAKLYLPNYQNEKFYNPWMPQKEYGLSRVLRWRFSDKKEYSQEIKSHKPETEPHLMARIKSLPENSNFITWIGHATFLIRSGGEYWLTDPMFSQRALLPKRITSPALAVNELSSLNGRINVLLSHNHYDHLDEKSIQNLPATTRFFVPKGLGKFVATLTEGEVHELNWWEEITTKTTSLVCLPAQHWSRRIFQGYNSTLWASYMIESTGSTIYFGGDSGYFKGYKEIGRKYPSIDFALLPITAYEPRWFMHYAHMDAREAISAFQDLGAKFFIPTQWGTFHLGDNPPGLPPLDLKMEIQSQNLEDSRFLVLNLGQIHLL